MDVVDRAAVAPDYRPQLVPAEFAGNGPFARLDAWLAANMETFGFFRPYTTDRGGVQPEPWHLSFAPVAEPALAALTPQMLSAALAASGMHGREAVLARLPEIYTRYVTAIDPPRNSIRRPGLFDVTQQQSAGGRHRIVEGGKDRRIAPQENPVFAAQDLAQIGDVAVDRFHIGIATVKQNLKIPIGTSGTRRRDACCAPRK
jgi:hypothetical protein